MHYAPTMEFVVAIAVCLVLLVVVYIAFKMLKLVLRLVLLTVFGVAVLGFFLTYGRPTLEKLAAGIRQGLSNDVAVSSESHKRLPPQQPSKEDVHDDISLDGGDGGSPILSGSSHQ